MPVFAGESNDDMQLLRQQASAFLVPVFDILDCTDQGFIESGEVDEHFAQVFNPMDRNRSRSLSRSEYLRYGSAETLSLREAAFDGIDTDRDQSVSALEFRSYLFQIIEIADTDGDGEVTREELTGPAGGGNTSSAHAETETRM